MDRMDHLEHLDKHLVDELAQVARETIRDELRQQTRKQRRTAMLYGASGAVALYAGAALALAVGLALAIALPDWAAALVTAAILGVIAYVLRGAARPTHRHMTEPAAGHPERVPGGAAPYPPMPPVAPGEAPSATGAPTADTPQPGTPARGPVPRPDLIDPENPHHRA
ncbi:phage holin family protein [Streptomyces sp. NPDC059866]|uniref:phage holin family protein n=1 Tax=unclassified Streptomyces TaxID=2593676 RepID=UPI00101E2F92|nr:phage holin family protein [Streptomyces sp. F001]RZB16970.1 hypothetical protein StrepF001_24010 [Streptomyces sp. F001]